MAKTAIRVAAMLLMGATVLGCKPAPPVDPKPCRTERRTVSTAIEAYEAETGQTPQSIDDLARYLESTATTWWTVSSDGTVVARPGATIPAGCVST